MSTTAVKSSPTLALYLLFQCVFLRFFICVKLSFFLFFLPFSLRFFRYSTAGLFQGIASTRSPRMLVKK